MDCYHHPFCSSCTFTSPTASSMAFLIGPMSQFVHVWLKDCVCLVPEFFSVYFCFRRKFKTLPRKWKRNCVCSVAETWRGLEINLNPWDSPLVAKHSIPRPVMASHMHCKFCKNSALDVLRSPLEVAFTVVKYDHISSSLKKKKDSYHTSSKNICKLFWGK